MSYQVLARKYRPKQFNEVVGQDSVLKSLIHGLSSNRLHHAYLFTGTRGVGKTSLARLLAKCLNCEKGVTDQPCGKCHQCQSLLSGNMVDLIEIDAASRTKVEDTRELLDQVQYMPTEARFKIYLIDEVHMLSTHSFNALLKTLEEPPEHVKFLLATTDPQKLPITILSRTLQYHLQPISQSSMIAQLEMILESESIDFELEALTYIVQKASGSLRDALSLLDQAINYGQGKVTTDDVTEMLGVVDQSVVFELAQKVLARDASAVLALTQKIIDQGKDIEKILDALSKLWYALSVYQLTQTVLFDAYNQDMLSTLAKKITPEMLQLYYQITIKSKPDISLTPDPKMALDMALLRMIAFELTEIRPLNTNQINKPDSKDYASKIQKSPLETKAIAPQPDKRSVVEKSDSNQKKIKDSNTSISSDDTYDKEWHDLVSQLRLRGIAKQVTLNSQCVDIKNDTYYLNSKVYSVTDQVKQKIKAELSQFLNKDIGVVFISEDEQHHLQTDKLAKSDITIDSNKTKEKADSLSEKKNLTPAEIQQEHDQALLKKNYDQLKSDAVVTTIESEFNCQFNQSYIKLRPTN